MAFLAEDIAALQGPATPNSESGLRSRNVTWQAHAGKYRSTTLMRPSQPWVDKGICNPATPNSESGLRTRSVTGKRMPESTGRQLWCDRPGRGLTRVIAKQDYPRGCGSFLFAPQERTPGSLRMPGVWEVVLLRLLTGQQGCRGIGGAAQSASARLRKTFLLAKIITPRYAAIVTWLRRIDPLVTAHRNGR
jgi:hypothetical protein